MAEFSTTKITPTDAVQIPSVNGQVAGYQENDELKSYILGTLPTQVSTNTEDIGENTSDIEGIRGSSQAFDATASYSAGDYCIYENVLYRFTSAKSAGAWDSAIVAVVDLPTLDGAVTSLSADVTNLGAKTVQGEFSLTLSFSGLTTGIFWNNQDRDITLVPSPSVVRGLVLYPKSDYAVWIGRIVLSNNKLIRLYLYSTSHLTDVTIAFDYVAFLV